MSNQEHSKNQPVIITGMHRSGTSLVASILEKAGVHIGEELLGANTSNPQGHFEDIDFLSFHQRILADQGISLEGWTKSTSVEVPNQFWDEARSLCNSRIRKHEIWGWKDPRSTLFLDFWKELLPEAVFVFVYRPPWEVIDSLFVRGDSAFKDNPKFAVEVWAAYNQAILEFVARCPEVSLLVNVQTLAIDENTLVSKANSKFSLNLTQSQDKIFQKGEMHSQANSTHRLELLAHFFPVALEIYQNLEDVADLPAGLASNRPQNRTMADYQDWIFQDWRTSSRLGALLMHTEAQTQRTQSELQSVRDELNITYSALQETRAELSETYTALQETRAELSETYTALEASRLEASQLYRDSKGFYEELQSTKAKLEHSRQIIKAMESSKFWALRNQWFKLKKHFLKLFSANTAKKDVELRM